MKKIFLLILSVILATSIFACLPSEESKTPESNQESIGVSTESKEESVLESVLDSESQGGQESNGESTVESVESVESSESVSVYYTVTFNTDGGSSVSPQTVLEGEKAVKPADPVKSNENGEYEFLGWYVGDVEWDFNSTITENLVIVAKWKLTEGYTNPFLPKS